MPRTGALTVRKARGRGREAARAGGDPDSKRRFPAAPLLGSRLPTRYPGSCCSLGPPRDRSRLDSTSPLSKLHKVIKRCVQRASPTPLDTRAAALRVSVRSKLSIAASSARAGLRTGYRVQPGLSPQHVCHTDRAVFEQVQALRE